MYVSPSSDVLCRWRDGERSGENFAAFCSVEHFPKRRRENGMSGVWVIGEDFFF